MTVSTFSSCIADLLLDKELIEANGNHIIKALLTAVIELTENKMIVRNIEPEMMMYSCDFKTVMFTNTNLMVRFF